MTFNLWKSVRNTDFWIKFHTVLTINVPVVFMARYVMILRGATSLRGALVGVGPENRDFFGPWNGMSEASAIWAQKSHRDRHRQPFSLLYVAWPWTPDRAEATVTLAVARSTQHVNKIWIQNCYFRWQWPKNHVNPSMSRKRQSTNFLKDYLMRFS